MKKRRQNPFVGRYCRRHTIPCGIKFLYEKEKMATSITLRSVFRTTAIVLIGSRYTFTLGLPHVKTTVPSPRDIKVNVIYCAHVHMNLTLKWYFQEHFKHEIDILMRPSWTISSTKPLRHYSNFI